MRISTSQYYANSVSTYAKGFADTAKTQEQISSGERIQTAADDPVGASKLLKLDQQKSLLTQYSNNMTSITNSLNNEESILSSVNDSLQRARELTIEAGNGGLSDADRQSIASELGEIEDTVYGLMNSKDSSGNYIFAGAKSDVQPYVRNSDGSYTYQGDQTQLSLQVSDTLSMASNDTGYSIFDSAANVSRTQSTLVSPTTDDGRVYVSSGEMTSSTSYNDDFSAGEPYTLTFTSSTQYTLTDKDGNDVTAQSAGNGTIDTSDDDTSSISLYGVEFNVDVSVSDDETSDADALVAGHSFTLSSKPDSISTSRTASNTSTAQITSASISDSTAYTSTFPSTGALIKFTSATEYQVYAQPYSSSSKAIASGTLSGSSITAAGVTFDISGTPEAGDQFSVSSNTNKSQNVLQTLADLRTALNTPVTDTESSTNVKNAVASAIGNIDSAMQQIDTTRGSIGARENAIDVQSSENSSLSLANDSTQSAIGDTDLASATAQLTLQQTMLEASQLAFAKISALSLFDKI
ncbi:flagellar hook-associated protein 3 [Pseudomonas typographi]|uniref:flagellar hook-associated protein 3 n=1 Tax=Pseudomonas typographi TaxID=2715964 RepID=UPI001682FA11|nr:flagellar hook-associated protein 3 [Pseudomonas typographi]MBD1550664.1 flagellar hook-associated protein 3 [Pseudomonas typographi]